MGIGSQGESCTRLQHTLGRGEPFQVFLSIHVNELSDVSDHTRGLHVHPKAIFGQLGNLVGSDQSGMIEKVALLSNLLQGPPLLFHQLVEQLEDDIDRSILSGMDISQS